MIAFLKMCYRRSFFQYKRVSIVSRFIYQIALLWFPTSGGSLTADVAADARGVSSGYANNDGLACDLEVDGLQEGRLSFLCPYGNESFPVYAEHIDAGVDSSPSTSMLSEVACSLKNAIVGGSILERCRDKMYNTCYYSSSLHKKVYECGQMQEKRKICLIRYMYKN
ncbi:nitrilase/cyanide hydratase and apolipoprotein N-acyltransferase family protein [Tanacetum coccineum]